MVICININIKACECDDFDEILLIVQRLPSIIFVYTISNGFVVQIKETYIIKVREEKVNFMDEKFITTNILTDIEFIQII